MGATHIIIAPSDMSKADSISMINDIKKVDGVKLAVSLDSILGPTIPDDMVPDEAKEIFKNGDYQMMLVSSKYATASDEVNNQITDCIDLQLVRNAYRCGTLYIGSYHYHRFRLQACKCGINRIDIPYHSRGIQIGIASNHTCSGHRVCNLCKHGNSGIYRNEASVYREHRNRNHTAWCNG